MARFALAVVISAVALVGAVRLTAPADTASSVRRQLVFLRSSLEDGAAARAQSQFPEGYFFLYALYGLAEVDQDSLADARWALSELDSDAGREPFSAGLTPAYGVFYRGWLNWLPADLRHPRHVASIIHRFLPRSTRTSPATSTSSSARRSWPAASARRSANIRTARPAPPTSTPVRSR